VPILLLAIVALLAALAFLLLAFPVLAATALAGMPQAAPSALARAEIPAVLLAHYQHAPACDGLPWQVVAAIGWVETRHATYGGARVDPVTGDVAPPIVGIALDGSRSAAIRVPPGGSPWHNDPIWDHATGPMQFITSTWTAWGIDASGDGVASPHNAYDAIATTGRYLCGGQARLVGSDAVAAAIRRYNSSDRYISDVLTKALAYGMADGGDPVGTVPTAGDLGTVGPMLRGDARVVVAYALAQLGKPYVYAADGPDAFDCSGLTMAAYRQIGVRLPHRADLQVRYGRPIDWRREPIRPGDLLFLRGGRPVHDYGHVGIAISTVQWVQAPRTGEFVEKAPLPYNRLQAVRRILAN
jgi:cell wall-associated NlpC family hydrolase